MSRKKKKVIIDKKFFEPSEGLDLKLRYAGYPVRFSFRFCSTKKGECIKSLEKSELKKLYAKLKKLEGLRWNDFNRLQDTCIEKKGTENYKFLKEKVPTLSRYFHFKVDDTFRVFGGQEEDLCCILFFDPKHRTNK